MPSIKEYNQKLKSLKNTQKITRTMKMVAASKLHKAHEAQANAKIYAHDLTALTSRISTSVDSKHHPLLMPKEEEKKILIVVFTSDKGLCGAFNHNAHRHTLNWIQENKENFEHIDVSCCGKKGFHFFSKMDNVYKYYENITLRPKFHEAEALGRELIELFMQGTYDRIYLAYNQFISPISQKTIFEQILPIDPEGLLDAVPDQPPEYIYEPTPAELLEFLIPHFLYFKVFFALLENAAGEHGARMSAMDSATKNASELIDKNTRFRNRARQDQITTELTEIIAGAEAL